MSKLGGGVQSNTQASNKGIISAMVKKIKVGTATTSIGKGTILTIAITTGMVVTTRTIRMDHKF